MYVHEYAYLGLIFCFNNVFGVMFQDSTNWLPALISLDAILYNLGCGERERRNFCGNESPIIKCCRAIGLFHLILIKCEMSLFETKTRKKKKKQPA